MGELSNNSHCMKIFFPSADHMKSFIDNMVESMKELRSENHLDSYFFNRYTNPVQEEYFLQVGFFNFDEVGRESICELLKRNPSDNIEKYECEVWDIDEVNIEYLKCCSVEMYEKIVENIENISLSHLAYILHFLMNQLALGYKNEILLYESMIVDLTKELEKRSQPP